LNKSLEKLLTISSASLSSSNPGTNLEIIASSKKLKNELLSLLRKKNGFYVFESALHVFPIRSAGSEIGLLEWNEPSLWKNEYQGLADDCLFFAEDIFGIQFCIKDNAIYQ